MNEYLKCFVGLDENFPFLIELSGITYPSPNYHIIRECSDVWVIEYVLEGKGYVLLGDETHEIEKDMIYFLPEGMRHEYYADPKDPYKKIFMNVSGELCKQLVFAYGLSKRYFFACQSLKPVFEKIVSVLRSEQTDYEKQCELQGIFIEILSKLQQSVKETKHSTEALTLKRYLDANLGKIVSSEELAKQIFRSKDYCQKLFSREFRTTPYAYQLERKIQTAKTLLSETDITVGEIAEELGYSDIHYFSNLFQKKCGTRPLQYRKSKR